MTVTNEIRKFLFYGNGVTTVWDAPNLFFYENAHIKLRMRPIGSEEWTVVPENNYSVSGAQTGSCSVTFPLSGAPLTATEELSIERVVPFTQTGLNLSAASGFSPLQLQREIDLAAMRDQQIRDGDAGFWALVSAGGFTLPASSVRPDNVISGGLWLRNTVVPWEIYFYDGTGDRLLWTINPTSGTVVFTAAAAALAAHVVSGDHDERYFTETEVNALFAAQAATIAAAQATADSAVAAVAVLKPNGGSWTGLFAGNNAALVLPAGGTWAYFAIQFDVATTYEITDQRQGIAAGGTIVATGAAARSWRGFAWRIG